MGETGSLRSSDPGDPFNPSQPPLEPHRLPRLRHNRYRHDRHTRNVPTAWSATIGMTIHDKTWQADHGRTRLLAIYWPQ